MHEGPRPHRNEDRGEEKKGITRRNFLGKAANLGAALAVATSIVEGVERLPDLQNWLQERVRRRRFDKWHGLDVTEREKHIKEEVEHTRDFLRSPEGKRVLEAGTDDEIFALLSSLPAILREHVAGTSYDINKDTWPSVAVGFSREHRLPHALGLQYGREKIARSYRGNGVFVAPDTLLTNWHVLGPYENSTHTSGVEAAQDDLPSRLKKQYEKGLDALYVRYEKPPTFESDTSRPHVYPLSSDISDADVVGNLVTLAGIDPDESSAEDGSKLFPSIAVPVTKRLAIFLERYAGYKDLDVLCAQKSFLYITPPGEEISRLKESATGSRLLDIFKKQRRSPGKRFRAQGTSGSPVLMDGKLVGLNHRGVNIAYKGTGLDAALFHGPSALREAKTAGLECSEKDVAVLMDAKEGGYSYSDSYGGYEDTYEDYWHDNPPEN